MGRKSLTGEKGNKYAKFRVDTEVQGILENVKAQGANISDFIRNSIKSSDSQCLIYKDLLEVLFPYFVVHGIQTQEGDLTNAMIQKLDKIGGNPMVQQKIQALMED